MSFSPEALHVVAVINNPPRFKSRERLYREFAARMERAGVHLVTVEAAFQERAFKITEAGNPDHVQFVQSEELWLKENLINLGVQRLPRDWKYLAWIDADVSFVRDDWAVETVHQLQHYAVVQMFQTAVDVGPTGEHQSVFTGFGFEYASGNTHPLTEGKYVYGKFWHPGYAWAMNREAFNDVGGLLDTAILGAGDHHMALSLIGLGQKAMPKDVHPNYRAMVMRWQDRAERHIRHNLGYVPGTLVHYWHGKKKDRRYWDRWQILKRHGYDPLVDVKRDWQGLLTLSDQGLRMRNDLRRYFRARNEDSIDVE